jgi:hypothetical protein
LRWATETVSGERFLCLRLGLHPGQRAEIINHRATDEDQAFSDRCAFRRHQVSELAGPFERDGCNKKLWTSPYYSVIELPSRFAVDMSNQAVEIKPEMWNRAIGYLSKTGVCFDFSTSSEIVLKTRT